MMKHFISFTLWLAACMSLTHCYCNRDKLIIVKKTEAKGCTTKNHIKYCNTLDEALIGDLTNTCINILENQTMTYRHPLYKFQNFTLTGNLSAGFLQPMIVISCENEAKLSLVDSYDIIIENLIFVSCGGSHSGDYFITKKNNRLIEEPIVSALYMRNVSKLSISSVNFKESDGYSVILVSCFELLKFTRVFFTSNKLVTHNQKQLKYGGGVFITYSPGSKQTKNFIVFSACQFEFINATTPETKESSYGVTNPYGNGGALSIILEDYSFVNLLLNDSTTFSINRGLWGAAFYSAMIGTTHNTTINFDSVRFNRNTAVYSGGAIRIVKRNFTNNVVYINKALLSYNAAEVGGALSQIFSQYDTNVHTSHDFIIIQSTFRNNSAKLGSAIYFENTNAVIFGGQIAWNSIVSNKSDTSSGKLSTVSGVGAVYVYKGKFIVGGNLIVRGNLNTAFVLEHANIFFSGEGIRFIENKGSYGGALALYEHSKIMVSNITDALFLDNTANKGGAIYVHLSGPPLPLWDSPELLLYNCFIEFKSGNSKDFLGKMNFTGNTAIQDNGNSIYATTIQNCVESKSDNREQIIIDWRGFYFPNSSKEIVTDPINISISIHEWSKISPGLSFKPTIQLLDERNNSVSGPLDINLNSTDVRMLDKSSRKIVFDESIDFTLVSSEYNNSPFEIALNSPSGRPIPRDIKSRLNICPFGYTYSKQVDKCVCFNKKNQDRMISKCIGKDVYLYNNVWAAKDQLDGAKDAEKTLVCPPGYCKICKNIKSGYPPIDCKYDPDNQCDETRDQMSNLCGSCKKGWAVTFGSEKCHPCKNAKGKYWIPPAIICTIFLIVGFILIFDVDVYADLLSVTFFFYQSVDILYTPTQQIMAQDYPMKFIIGILQLNGIHIGHVSVGVCFSENFDDADKLMLNYLIPFSMIFSLLLYIWVSNSRCQIIRFSIGKVKSIKAFIFIMVVAYTDFIRLTFNLLHPVEINHHSYFRGKADIHFFEGKHKYYGVFAVLIGCAVVIGFPLLLLLSSLNVKCKWLSKLIPYQESFNSCFKKNRLCQSFSVYYFAARLILLGINTQPKTQLQASFLGIVSFILLIAFATVQPYESYWSNMFDIAVLFCYTFIAFCSNGKLKILVNDSNDQLMATLIQVVTWVPLVLWLIMIFYKYRKSVQGVLKKCFCKSKCVQQENGN